MHRLLAAIWLLAGAHVSLAQQSIPVFSNKKDSADYSQVQAAIFEMFNTRDQKQRMAYADSLLKLQAELRITIVGYRKATHQKASNPWHPDQHRVVF